MPGLAQLIDFTRSDEIVQSEEGLATFRLILHDIVHRREGDYSTSRSKYIGFDRWETDPCRAEGLRGRTPRHRYCFVDRCREPARAPVASSSRRSRKSSSVRLQHVTEGAAV